MDRALDIANERVPRFACKPGLSRSGGLPATNGEPEDFLRNALASLLPKKRERGGRGVWRLKVWGLAF